MERQALIDAGFKPTTYEGDAGEYLTKRQPVSTLPYANEHIVDGEYVSEDMVAVTEVLPDGSVQMSIADADYVEGPHPAGSQEAEDLLKDALAA